MYSLTFEGRVVKGKGSGKKYLSLSWVKRQIEEKTGFTPYLGTLNLELDEEGINKRKVLYKTQSQLICPAEGYCLGLLFKACIKNLVCAVVIPEVKNYPENTLEIISTVNLREKLKLKDGDVVSVSVSL